MSDIEATRLGDRLTQLGGIADFLRGLDPAKINEIVAQLTAFLKVVLGLFGREPPAAAALSVDEETAVQGIFTAEQVQARAIDLAAIAAFVKIALQLFAAFKKPAG
jgi:hypothetical protein